MLLGYLGAGLAAKAAAPRIGLGTLFAAALLLDILLWLFVILHVEGAVVPPDFDTRHMLTFAFPWSHSLVAALVWSVLAAFVWTWSGGEGKYLAYAPAIVALTVFSHWALDFLVHPAELPLWPGAPAVGMDIGQPAALILDVVVAAIGFALFLWRVPMSAPRRTAIGGVLLLSAGLTYVGGTAPEPQDILNVAAISLLAMFVIVTVGAITDRAPT
jgi:hypothetical protein